MPSSIVSMPSSIAFICQVPLTFYCCFCQVIISFSAKITVGLCRFLLFFLCQVRSFSVNFLLSVFAKFCSIYFRSLNAYYGQILQSSLEQLCQLVITTVLCQVLLSFFDQVRQGFSAKFCQVLWSSSAKFYGLYMPRSARFYGLPLPRFMVFLCQFCQVLWSFSAKFCQVLWSSSAKLIVILCNVMLSFSAKSYCLPLVCPSVFLYLVKSYFSAKSCCLSLKRTTVFLCQVLKNFFSPSPTFFLFKVLKYLSAKSYCSSLPSSIVFLCHVILSFPDMSF